MIQSYLLIETLNFVLTSQRESGLQEYYLNFRKRVVEGNGKQFANQVANSSEYYSTYAGFAFKDRTGDKLIIFLLYLLLVPLSVSMVLFAIEKFVIVSPVLQPLSPTTPVFEFKYIS